MRLSNVFLPDTLDTQVGELHCHVLVVDVHGADPLLTPISANTGRTDQVVRVSLGRIRIMGHATHHHHSWSSVVHNLYLGKTLLICFDLSPCRAPAPRPSHL